MKTVTHFLLCNFTHFEIIRVAKETDASLISIVSNDPAEGEATVNGGAGWTTPPACAANYRPRNRDNEAVTFYWGNDGNMASLLINIYRITDPANPGSFPRPTTIFGGMTAWSFNRLLVPSKTRFDDALGVVFV